MDFGFKYSPSSHDLRTTGSSIIDTVYILGLVVEITGITMVIIKVGIMDGTVVTVVAVTIFSLLVDTKISLMDAHPMVVAIILDLFLVRHLNLQLLLVNGVTQRDIRHRLVVA